MITILCWVIGLALLPVAIQVVVSLIVLVFVAIMAPIVWVFKSLEAQTYDFKKAYRGDK